MEGVRLLVPAIDVDWLGRLTRALRASAEGLRDRSASDVVARLGRVGARFLDAGDAVRREALELLPPTSGLSRAMAVAVLDGMAADWTEERLGELVRRSLGGPAALDGFMERDGRSARALGPELCVQISSGSVAGVGVSALLRSLVVKAPTLLKPGRGDVVLPVLFARALAEEDEALARSLAVVYWPGGEAELEDAALSAADVVVAYAGDEAVGSLRRRTPPTARFIAYHHRVGVGIVGKAALRGAEAERCAVEVARAVALFDQRGCVSPQVIFVEEGGPVSPADFARRVGEALAALESSLPAGRLDDAEASALRHARDAAELRAAADPEMRVHHGGTLGWTVVFDPRPGLPSGCAGRMVRVEPVTDVLQAADRLAPLGRHLQSVAVAGVGDRSRALAERLGRAGASRITSFARVAFPPPWWRHDGMDPLGALIRWVELEG